MESLQNQLLQLIECPICYKYMAPPIRMCCKGHSTCDQCTVKYNTCIICQYPFLTTRNLALEAISFELGIQCNNCRKYFTSDILYEHKCEENYEENEEILEDSVYLCRITDLDKNYNKQVCRWAGDPKEIDEHFVKEHANNYFILAKGQLFIWTLPYAQDQENISVVVKENDSFLQEVYYEHKTKRVYFTVYVINTANERDFTFKILIPKKNKKTFEQPVVSKYEKPKKLKKEENILEIDLDVFDMRKDREIKWILSVHKQ